MCPQTHGQTQRVSPWVAESHPQGSFNYGLLWWIILICLVHSPYLAYLRILPCVHTHLSAKMDSAAKACGQNLPWQPSSLTCKEPFCACVVREVSRLQEREIHGLGRAQLPPLIALLFPSWSFSPHGMNESPISLPWVWGSGVGGGGRHLPPAYVHCLVNRVVITLKYPTAASCWFPV